MALDVGQENFVSQYVSRVLPVHDSCASFSVPTCWSCDPNRLRFSLHHRLLPPLFALVQGRSSRKESETYRHLERLSSDSDMWACLVVVMRLSEQKFSRVRFEPAVAKPWRTCGLGVPRFAMS